MRKTLEDLYFGNITPNEQKMVPDSELKKALDRVVRYENQLTELLNEDGQTILTKLIRSHEPIRYGEPRGAGQDPEASGERGRYDPAPAHRKAGHTARFRQ